MYPVENPQAKERISDLNILVNHPPANYNRNWPDGQAGQGFPGKFPANYNNFVLVNGGI